LYLLFFVDKGSFQKVLGILIQAALQRRIDEKICFE